MTNYLCNDVLEVYEECKEFYNISKDEEFGLYLINFLEIEIEDFINNFKGENLMIVGTYGRWNGKFDICKPIENAQELINFLEQWDYYKLFEENNKIKIKCSDHDGISYFELKQLRKKYQYSYIDIIDDIKPNTVDKFFKRISKKEMNNFLN